MSVIFVVAPIVTGVGWPILTAAAAAAAAKMGLKALESSGTKATGAMRTAVEIDVDNVDALAAGVRPDDKLTFGNERLRVTLARDARGRCTVHVDGQGTEEELRAQGTAFLQRAMQQYAYQKVAVELKKRGFKIVQEEVTEKQQIRIRFRKFE